MIAPLTWQTFIGMLFIAEVDVRILMLAQFYPPILGGVERHVQDLSRALANRGHRVAVVTLWHKGTPEFEMDGNVRVYRIHGTMQRLTGLFTTDRQHSPPFPDPEVTFALRQILLREKPDIVHAHNWIIHSFLPLKGWSGAKLVLTLHDCELTCVQMRMAYLDRELCDGPAPRRCIRCAGEHYGLMKGLITLSGNQVMSRLERSLVDIFLPVSHAIADANQLTGSRTPFQVVPNFIPDNPSENGRIDQPDSARLPADGFILQVGDLVVDKGIEVILQGYRGLKSAPPLVLIGRRLIELPTDLPPGVIIFEDMPHEMVMQAWEHSLFGTVPSLCLDACPTVTIEAMSAGKPVIGSQIGGIQDQILDGVTGFLVPPGDVQALQEAMTKLIENPALREKMGKAARVRASEFQASAVVQKIEAVYQTL